MGDDCLLVLAQSAELMSRCDGNFDTAIRVDTNNADRISIRKCLDESAHVSENVLTHLNQIQHLPPCGNDSLVQESNEEHFVVPLPRKKVRLTKIKCQARSKHGSLEQQCTCRLFRGKAIRLTNLHRLARTKDARIWAQKLGFVSCRASEDEQMQMSKQCGSQAICQLNCVFSEIDTINEYGSCNGDNQCDEDSERLIRVKRKARLAKCLS